MSRSAKITYIVAACLVSLGLALIALPHVPLPAGHAASETPDVLLAKLGAMNGARPPEPEGEQS